MDQDPITSHAKKFVQLTAGIRAIRASIEHSHAGLELFQKFQAKAGVKHSITSDVKT